MSKIKKDCFWYSPERDMSATIDCCTLSETYTCPCEEDCDWYITNKDAKKLVAQFVGAVDIYEEKYGRYR